MPLTHEIVAFFIQLLTAATEEMEKVEGFDEDLLREQLIKALQLKASRAILLHPECLQLALMSPVSDEPSEAAALQSSSPFQTPTLVTVRTASASLVKFIFHFKLISYAIFILFLCFFLVGPLFSGVFFAGRDKSF